MVMRRGTVGRREGARFPAERWRRWEVWDRLRSLGVPVMLRSEAIWTRGSAVMDEAGPRGSSAFLFSFVNTQYSYAQP